MRLVISDLHFGDQRALASHPLCLSRLEPLVADADEVIVAGDFFSLFHASFEECERAAEPFCELLHGRKVSLLAGNNDLPLFELARLGLLGDAVSGYFRRLLGAGVSLHETSLVADGVSVIHGHQFSPVYAGMTPDAETQRAWALALTCTVLARSCEHPCLEPLRTAARQVISREARPATSDGLRADADVLAAAQVTFRALGVDCGPVVVGHTHQRLHGAGAGEFTIYNPGSWVFDKFMLDRDPERHRARPGAVALIDAGEVKVVDLLSDLSERELQTLAAES